MTSIEGHRGEPRPRPPFPAVKGLWGKPSVLNNVETFANIPDHPQGRRVVRRHGHREEQGHQGLRPGRQRSTTPAWSKCRSACSSARSSTTSAAACPAARRFKAVQLGGPSGGCVPDRHLDTPVDYESLQELGAIMGSGGLVVMDEDTCMVDMARFFLEFTQEESCGKCPPCRVGTKRMLEIVERICTGEGEEGDIERLQELGADDQGDRPLRPRPDGPQPGAVDDPPLPSRVGGPHPRQALRGRRLRDHVQGALHQRLPRRRRRAGLRQPGRREALRRGPAPAPRAQPAGLDLRPRLLPPLREQVPARRPRRAGRHPRRQALHDRAGDRHHPAGDPRERRERRPQGGRDRFRSGRPVVRLLPGSPGLQADHLRGRRDPRRHARAGHPGLPAAARGARPRDLDDPGDGCDDRVRQGARPRLHPQGPAGRRLRGRVPRRRRSAGLEHRRARRRRRGRHRSALVPQDVQRRRHGRRGQARRGDRRRQLRHRRGPHRPAPRRRPGDDPLPPHARPDAGVGRRDRRRRGGAHRAPAARRAGRDRARRRRQAGRRHVPPDDPGRLRRERPSPAGGRPQRRLRRRVRPGDRRHRPVARQRAAVRRRPGRDHQEGLAQDRQGRPHIGRVDLRRRRRRHRSLLGRGRHRRRREGRRLDRRAPDAAPTTPSGAATSPSTPRSTPTPTPSRRRAPTCPSWPPACASAASTKSSSRGRPRWPSPKPGAACAATTERPVPRPR